MKITSNSPGKELIKKVAVLTLLPFCLFQLPTRVTSGIVTAAAEPCNCLVFFLGGIPAIGFVPGESIRITVSDPTTDEPDEFREPARAQVKLFDRQGNQVAESPEFSIPRDGFHSVEFSRNSILLSGESGTGRLEVRPTIILQRLANPQLPSNTAQPVRTGGSNSIELIDLDGRSEIWIDMGAPVRVRNIG
ncbi:MAG TPA: hypothetical protein VKN18_20960 [Blastocatellia bacterium]|nr:hypothetical protein [Blastocatellia bacterium]